MRQIAYFLVSSSEEVDRGLVQLVRMPASLAGGAQCNSRIPSLILLDSNIP